MQRRRRQPVKICFFCKEDKKPDFLEHGAFSHLVSERGKILARSRTGLCAKHQRRLTREVKRARFLALIPFVVRPE